MIAIIDYGSGNTQSVANAVERLGFETVLTSDINILQRADKVIFPGVGQAASAMQKLVESGLDDIIPRLEQPVLGICLGLQLMCRFSQEGNVNGLGIFDTEVVKFPSTGIVPHMGWNSVRNLGSPIFTGIPDGEDFYFVHSFAARICAETAGTNDYIFDFSAALQKDNFYAVQFHPEKSGSAGSQLLSNFLNL